jgi:hypothetical protein
MRKYLAIYEEAVCHTVNDCNCYILNFLILEENLIFFFISAVIPSHCPSILATGSVTQPPPSPFQLIIDLLMFLLTGRDGQGQTVRLARAAGLSGEGPSQVLCTIQHCFICRPSDSTVSDRDRTQDICDFGIGSQTL